jgi:hypothetical protein
MATSFHPTPDERRVLENLAGEIPHVQQTLIATIVVAAIVGSELRATAVAGNGRGGWKAPVRIAFVFTNEGLLLKGSAEVRMGDVPWITFGYDLERKRSRY